MKFAAIGSLQLLARNAAAVIDHSIAGSCSHGRQNDRAATVQPYAQPRLKSVEPRQLSDLVRPVRIQVVFELPHTKGMPHQELCRAVCRALQVGLVLPRHCPGGIVPILTSSRTRDNQSLPGSTWRTPRQMPLLRLRTTRAEVDIVPNGPPLLRQLKRTSASHVPSCSHPLDTHRIRNLWEKLGHSWIDLRLQCS